MRGVRRLIMRKLIFRKVWIETDECVSCLCCVEKAPGLIEFDEAAEITRVRNEHLQRTQEELSVVLDASQVCPVSAFNVDVDTGESFNMDESGWVHAAVLSGEFEWEPEK
jgi:ferredoxin